MRLLQDLRPPQQIKAIKDTGKGAVSLAFLSRPGILFCFIFFSDRIPAVHKSQENIVLSLGIFPWENERVLVIFLLVLSPF